MVLKGMWFVVETAHDRDVKVRGLEPTQPSQGGVSCQIMETSETLHFLHGEESGRDERSFAQRRLTLYRGFKRYDVTELEQMQMDEEI